MQRDPTILEAATATLLSKPLLEYEFQEGLQANPEHQKAQRRVMWAFIVFIVFFATVVIAFKFDYGNLGLASALVVVVMAIILKILHDKQSIIDGRARKEFYKNKNLPY